MALRQLAVVDHFDDVVADLADNVDGLPQPLAAVGIARGRYPPRLDVVLLEPGKRLFSSSFCRSASARAPREMDSWRLSSVMIFPIAV
jgi:hypothetical protein